ncbi:MAG: hypothetical protein ACOCV1_06295 [Bacillota bacterium]
MKLLLKILFILYFIFLSFTDTFSLSGILILPVIISVFIVFFGLIKLTSERYINSKNLKIYKSEDVFILIGLIGLIFSSLINPNSNSINYILAYFYVFLISIFFHKFMLNKYFNILKVLKYNFYGVLLTSSFVFVDFWFEFLGIINLQNYLPRTKEASATYKSIFPRAYGFSDEPTNLAFYLNTLGTLSLLYVWKFSNFSKITKLIFTFLVIFSWLVTFSSAGIVSMLFSITLVVFFLFFKNILKNKKIYIKKNNILFMLVFFLLILVLIFNINFIIDMFNPIYNQTKEAFEFLNYNNINKFDSRRVREWKFGLRSSFKDVNNFLFGVGPGYRASKGLGSLINWHLFLFYEGGLFTYLPFLLYLIFSGIRMVTSDLEYKWWFFIPFLAGCIHYFAISTFFEPFLWTLIIIFIISEVQYKNIDFGNRGVRQ